MQEQEYSAEVTSKATLSLETCKGVDCCKGDRSSNNNSMTITVLPEALTTDLNNSLSSQINSTAKTTLSLETCKDIDDDGQGGSSKNNNTATTITPNASPEALTTSSNHSAQIHSTKPHHAKQRNSGGTKSLTTTNTSSGNSPRTTPKRFRQLSGIVGVDGYLPGLASPGVRRLTVFPEEFSTSNIAQIHPNACGGRENGHRRSGGDSHGQRGARGNNNNHAPSLINYSDIVDSMLAGGGKSATNVGGASGGGGPLDFVVPHPRESFVGGPNSMCWRPSGGGGVLNASGDSGISMGGSGGHYGGGSHFMGGSSSCMPGGCCCGGGGDSVQMRRNVSSNIQRGFPTHATVFPNLGPFPPQSFFWPHMGNGSGMLGGGGKHLGYSMNGSAFMDMAGSGAFMNNFDGGRVGGGCPNVGGNNVFSASHKIYIPHHPSYNYIGRILGPRGNSVRRLEALTGCKILIRGRGSIKDPNREMRMRNMLGWEHLNEDLHVLITAEDATEQQCNMKLRLATVSIQRLLTPQFDEYKRQQLIQLAIINGTYRP